MSTNTPLHFRYADLRWLAFLSLLIVVTRVPLTSEMVVGDGLHYALGLKDFNVSEQRPHPPGNPLFVLTAKPFSLLGLNDNHALITASILYSIITVLFIYLICRDLVSRKLAQAASLIFCFVPLFWFEGEVSQSNTAGAAGCAMVAYFALQVFLREEKLPAIFVLAAALGLAGGLRQDLLVHMFPLVFWTLLKHWKGWRTFLMVMAIIGFTVALWYVPMVLLSGGYQKYAAATSRQFNYHVTRSSILFGNSLFSHFRMIKEFLLCLIGAAFIPLFYVSLYWVTARRDFLLRMRDWRTTFLVLWILPATLFLTIVFFQNSRYLLSLLAAVYIGGTYALITLTRRFIRTSHQRRAIAVQIGALVLLQSVHFLSPPLLKETMAMSKPWSEKTMSEAIETMVFNTFFRVTHSSLTKSNEASKIYLSAIRALSTNPDEVTLLLFSRSSLLWTQPFYYLPEYAIYGISDDKPKQDELIAVKNFKHNGFLLDSTIYLNPQTKYVVVVAFENSPEFQNLRQQIEMKKRILDSGFKMYTIENRPMKFHVKHHLFTTE